MKLYTKEILLILFQFGSKISTIMVKTILVVYKDRQGGITETDFDNVPDDDPRAEFTADDLTFREQDNGRYLPLNVIKRMGGRANQKTERTIEEPNSKERNY